MKSSMSTSLDNEKNVALGLVTHVKPILNCQLFQFHYLVLKYFVEQRTLTSLRTARLVNRILPSIEPSIQRRVHNLSSLLLIDKLLNMCTFACHKISLACLPRFDTSLVSRMASSS